MVKLKNILLYLFSPAVNAVTFTAPTGNQYGPTTGNLRLGIVGKLTQRSGCGAVRLVAASRAIDDINTRNATFCPAIANLAPTGDAGYFTVSTGYLDNAGSPTLAIQGGLHFNQNMAISGATNHASAVHGILGFTTSGTTLAGTKTMKALGLPMICYSATSPLLSVTDASGNLEHSNFFRVVPGDHNRVLAGAKFINGLGVTKAVSLYFSDDYTKSMCKQFEVTAKSTFNMDIVSKELPTTGNSGTSPGATEIVIINKVLKEIRDDPNMPRAIMLCAFSLETAAIMTYAKNLGMRPDTNTGYMWFSPDDGLAGEDKYLGMFLFKWKTHSARSDLFKYEYDNGAIPYTQQHAHMFDEAICAGPGSGTSIIAKACNGPEILQYHPQITTDKYFRFNETQMLYKAVDADGNPLNSIDTSRTKPYSELIGNNANDNFDKCKTYTQFGYDAVVMYAAAMDKGIKAGAFTKTSVTSALLEAQLKALVGDTNYGECLSPGALTFTNLQERTLPYLVYNMKKDTAGVISTVEMAEVAQVGNTITYNSDSSQAFCSAFQNATDAPCFTSTGPVTGKIATGSAPACNAGQYFVNGTCTNAPVGSFAPAQAAGTWLMESVLTGCAPGSYTDVAGSTTCTLADAGYYTPAAGADELGPSSQQACAAGHFSGEKGSPVCFKCSPGSYQPSTGQTQCLLCPAGEVQPLAGQTSCMACPSDRTTNSVGATLKAACLCKSGSYEPNKDNLVSSDYAAMTDMSSCISCSSGISCPIGSTFYDALNEKHTIPGYTVTNVATGKSEPLQLDNMFVKEGFYLESSYNAAGASKPITDFIYSCDVLGESALSQDGYISPCKGGGAGDLACGEGREGLACGRCVDGYYRNLDNGCNRCQGVDGIGLVFFFIVAFGGTIAAYFFINGRLTAELSPIVVVAISFGTFVATMQSCAVLSSMSISWPDSLKGLWAFTQLFALDLKILRSECLIGTNVVSSFMTKVLFPYVLLAFLFGVAFVSRQVYPEGSYRHMTIPKSINTYASFYQAAFITLLLAVISPFRTFKHPGTGDRFSLVAAPYVTTDSDDYSVMVVISLLGLCPCIAFLAFYVYAIATAAEKSSTPGNENYMQCIKFVLFRFHGGAHYWGLVFLFRSTMIAFATTLDAQKPFVQTILLAIILLSYCLVQQWVWPWRGTLINYMDAVQTMLVVLMLMVASALTSPGEVDKSTHDVGAGLVLFSYTTIFLGITSILGKSVMETVRSQNSPTFRAQLASRKKEKSQALGAAMTQVGRVIAETSQDMNVLFVENISEVDQKRLAATLDLLCVEFCPDKNLEFNGKYSKSVSELANNSPKPAALQRVSLNQQVGAIVEARKSASGIKA